MRLDFSLNRNHLSPGVREIADEPTTAKGDRIEYRAK